MANGDCVLTFKNYEVNEISFVKNNKFKNEGFEGLDFNIDTNIKYPKNPEENKFAVKLRINFGEDAITNNYPFTVIADITGFFELDLSQLGDMKQFAEVNAVSILFPYLRSLITTVTANANIPPVIIPPMNIAGMIQKENAESNQ